MSGKSNWLVKGKKKTSEIREAVWYVMVFKLTHPSEPVPIALLTNTNTFFLRIQCNANAGNEKNVQGDESGRQKEEKGASQHP